MNDPLDVADKMASVAAAVVAFMMAILQIKWRMEDKGIALTPQRRTLMKSLFLGLMALIVLTLALALLNRVGSSPDPSPSPSVSVTPSKDNSVRFAGNIILTDNVDLDSTPPRIGKVGSVVSPTGGPHDVLLVVWFEDNSLGLHVNGKIHGRDGEAASRETCKKLVKSAKDMGQRKSPIGESLCVKTTEGRVASIVVKHRVVT